LEAWVSRVASQASSLAVAAQASRESVTTNDLAIDIIAGAIRSAQHELLIEAAEFVLSGEPIEIARKLRERADQVTREGWVYHQRMGARERSSCPQSRAGAASGGRGAQSAPSARASSRDKA
jgi:hypothetical protein